MKPRATVLSCVKSLQTTQMFLNFTVVFFLTQTNVLSTCMTSIHKLLALWRNLRGFEINFKMQQLKEELHLYPDLCTALWSELLGRGSHCCFRALHLQGQNIVFLSGMCLSLEFSRDQLQ